MYNIDLITTCIQYPYTYIYIYSVQICAFHKKMDTCGGDSGGPLTIAYERDRSVLVGVVSYGPAECANGRYVNLELILNVIENELVCKLWNFEYTVNIVIGIPEFMQE